MTESFPARRPNRRPTHPGEVLKEDVLPALKMTIADAARELQVSRQMLHRVLSGEATITPEMAVRLGKFCGNGAAIWINMQIACGLWDARQKLAGTIDEIPTHNAA
jgi:antitoxin HigA-1